LNKLKRYNKLLFYYKSLAPLLINLQQHFLHTTPILNFTYTLLQRFFALVAEHFSTLQPATRSHEGNSCSPVKAKTVTCEKFELFRPTFSCHSEKEDKTKNRNIYLNLKNKRRSKVTDEIALLGAILVFKISAARAQQESEYQGKKSANQIKVAR